MSIPELLAPAGSLEALYAAVDQGADAVYLGVGRLNARANAENLTEDQLVKAVEYAHLRSTKVYLAINTLFYDSEFDEGIDLARKAILAGIDAIIVQDLGFAAQIHNAYPGVALHASTQMNLFSRESLRLAIDLGITRIVLPRELSISEIRTRVEDAREFGLETEVFIHGALCVCYSGICLFSAMNGGGQRSGNRGLCAQPCRMPYALKDYSGRSIRTGRLLSPKDRSAIPVLSDLIATGVTSLKIEGRMKDASYVSSVVNVYRRQVDSILSDQSLSSSVEEDSRHLLLAFNRGGSFTDAYLSGHKGPDFLSGDYSGRFGMRIGDVAATNPKSGDLSVRTSMKDVGKGDYLSIREKDVEKFSFPIGQIEVRNDRIIVKGLHPDALSQVLVGSDVYLMSEKIWDNVIQKNKARTKISINFTFEDNTALVVASVVSGSHSSVAARTERSLPASDYPSLSPERITEQLSKSGGTPFEVMEVSLGSTSYPIPVSMVNELRRDTLRRLEEAILQAPTNPSTQLRAAEAGESHADSKKRIPDGSRLVRYPDLRRCHEELSVNADMYAFSARDLCEERNRSRISALFEKEPKARLFTILPDSYKDEARERYLHLNQILSGQFGERYLGFIASISAGVAAFYSSSSNIFNRESLLYALKEQPMVLSLSHELKETDQISLLRSIPTGCFKDTCLAVHHYGRIPWMQTAFCPIGQWKENCSACQPKGAAFSLQPLTADGKSDVSEALPIEPDSSGCSAIIWGHVLRPQNSALLAAARERQIPILYDFTFLSEPISERISILSSVKEA